jgi:hypothetical protein
VGLGRVHYLALSNYSITNLNVVCVYTLQQMYILTNMEYMLCQTWVMLLVLTMGISWVVSDWTNAWRISRAISIYTVKMFRPYLV